MDSRPSPSKPLFRPTLIAAGRTDDDIRGLHRRDELRRIRPGAYIDAVEWQTLAQQDRHRLLIDATLPKLGAGAVLSHVSAALLHGLPVLSPTPELVHVSRATSSGGYRRGNVHSHPAKLDADAVTQVDGVLMTSVARTVIDCACLLGLSAGVCMADFAIHQKLIGYDDLVMALAAAGRRQGIRRAAQVLGRADGLSESPGESLSRLAFQDIGIPEPSLQVRICDGIQELGRVDFLWKEFRTIGEFDGRVKYGRLLKPGQEPGDAVWQEKVREDALARLSWEVVRWTLADLAKPKLLGQRIWEAFELGLRYV